MKRYSNTGQCPMCQLSYRPEILQWFREGRDHLGLKYSQGFIEEAKLNLLDHSGSLESAKSNTTRESKLPSY